ncbi:membrane protein [Spirochaetia bacterium]|nr:membrane protein [Spirochaetia bacterium]
MQTIESRRSISGTIFRAVIRETLFSFLVAFLFFFFIFFVNQLLLMAQEILAKRVPVIQVALLVLYSLPSIVAMAAPFASLVGTLMTIGRMTSDNEVLVLLSSGLSYRNILIPAFIVGLFISTVSFIANDVLLPAGTVEFSKLYRRILISTPALELEANSVKRFKETVIVTGAVDGTSIDNVLILDRTGAGERRIIMAANAELQDSGREGLSLSLSGAFVQSSKEIARQDYDYASSESLRYWVPQEDMMQAVSSIGPREMSSMDVYTAILEKEDLAQEQSDEYYNAALVKGLELEHILRNGPRDSAWLRRENLLAAFLHDKETAKAVKSDRTLLVYRLEFFKKFSIPTGAFSFVFLAVPLGLLAKKSGQTVGFIFGLIIAVIYWALLLGGQTLGMRLGYSPFWTMWLPNVLAIGIGLILCIIRLRK